ncbi:ligand-gated channel protein [Stutzerimonas stutzeri]|uniref:Ligand-gated channel protein n=1 Tax=Stutzerimonas stutzeri TaxID=316 RepID=W8QXK9_STUST|nr:TonB-dependent vitamin B12 receptor [Stutzerimonas stutzeri]AHL74989.1 ligand-gated channel protein [Stutzerimonas stutzeri]MCQ4331315.1 TonB-dependent vitamin B12 receptor [Stutzerimonas stutzeri]
MRSPLSLAVVLLGLPTYVLAESSAALHLDQQLITASRTGGSPVSIASSSVITRDEIERQQATNVPELLQRLAGVSITSNGGRGKSTSVSIRGTSDKHVLVLIDGVRIGSATSGSAALQSIPVEQIERIEIVRGPRSSLYGSEAMGGVIQIFTRRGGADGVKPYFSVGAGSRSSYSGSAGVAGGHGNGWFNLGVASESTDGINARAYRSTAPNAFEPDADGYRELSALLRAGYRLDNGLELDGSWLQSENHSDFDSRSSSGASGRDAYSDGSLQAISGRARFSPLAFWDVTLQAAHSEDLSDNFQDGNFFSRFDTRRDSLSWQNDLRLGEAQVLSLGMDYQTDRIDSSGDYAEDSRYNKGYFIQYQAAFGRHGVQAGLRRDDDEFFGSHDTGSLGYSFDLSDALTLTAAYGTAYRAPTFNDLYYPASASTAGNPDVQPEESESYEIGVRGSHGWGEWSVNAYENQIEDLIVWAGSSPMRPENVDVARIRGIETTVATVLAGWNVAANLTFMDPQDRSKANHGHLLQRRAKRQFNLDLDRQFGAIGLGASLYAASERFDKVSNVEDSRMPGYALMDLRGEYRIDEAWRLQAKLANLFDREYETTQTYEQPGRAVYFTVRYQAL